MKISSKSVSYDFDIRDGYSLSFDVYQKDDNVNVEVSWCEDDLTFDDIVEFANVVAQESFVLGKEYMRKADRKEFDKKEDKAISLRVMLYKCRDAIKNGNVDTEMADEINKVLGDSYE